jgi:hypothetical protein
MTSAIEMMFLNKIWVNKLLVIRVLLSIPLSEHKTLASPFLRGLFSTLSVSGIERVEWKND